MKYLLIFLSVAVLAGCDKVTSETATATGDEYEGTASCSKVGYCLTCGPSFDGKVDCMPRFRPNCPGSQPATLQNYSVHRVYESGAVETYTRTSVVRRTGECQ